MRNRFSLLAVLTGANLLLTSSLSKQQKAANQVLSNVPATATIGVPYSATLTIPAGITVTATTCLFSPSLPRVLPGDFKNTRLLCRELAGRGYRGIGSATTHDSDRQTQDQLSAAMTWHVPPWSYRNRCHH